MEAFSGKKCSSLANCMASKFKTLPNKQKAGEAVCYPVSEWVCLSSLSVSHGASKSKAVHVLHTSVGGIQSHLQSLKHPGIPHLEIGVLTL